MTACNRAPFDLPIDCPVIDVNLSFPDLSYCEITGVYKPNGQILQAPKQTPQPDVAVVDANCINIAVSGFAKLGGGTVKAQGANGAEFGLQSRASSCLSGLYRLRVGVDVPCMLSGIPSSVGVFVGSSKVGVLKFDRASGCSKMSMHLDINNYNANANAYSGYNFKVLDIDTDTCILDDNISGEILHNDEECKLKIVSENCKIRKIQINVPLVCNVDALPRVLGVTPTAISSNPGIRIQGFYKNVVKVGEIVNNYAISIYSPIINIHRSKNKFVLSAPCLIVRGSRGKTGTNGKSGNLITARADMPGYTGRAGPRGIRGPTGTVGSATHVDCSMCSGYSNARGERGEKGVCEEGLYDYECSVCPNNWYWRDFTAVLTIQEFRVVDNCIRFAYVDCLVKIGVATFEPVVTFQDKLTHIYILSGKEFSW